MDSLLEAIRDAPDDDEPRLVWADREGGERGELVVLQCMLARREGTRADRVKMRERERQIIARDPSAPETWVRGFVERVRVPLAEVGPQLFERAPLLRAIELEKFTTEAGLYERPFPDEVWGGDAERLRAAFATLPAGRLRSLCIPAVIVTIGHEPGRTETRGYGDGCAAVVASLPSLAGLTELELADGELTSAAFPHLAKLPLERLATRPNLPREDLAALLRAVPTLSRLSLSTGQPSVSDNRLAALLDSPEAARLRELDLHYNHLGESDLERLGGCAALAGLERLGLGYAKITTRGWEAIAQSPHLANLRELAIPNAQGFHLAMLRHTRFRLRHLTLGELPAGAAPHLLALPDLERVDFTVADQADRSALAAAIPYAGYW